MTIYMKNKDNNRLLFRLPLLLLMMLCTMVANAQNTLRVEDFTAAAGKEASLPIYLDNSSEVVGMQFDILLPFAKSQRDVTLLANRSDGHTVSLRRINDKCYTVVVMSVQNKPLKGNSGLLMRFPVSISSDAQADDVTPFSLSNIVLTDRQGHNVASAATSQANFTVLRTPTPDFTISDLRILNSESSVAPGGKLQLSFSVNNQGTGESRGGWTEKVWLEDLTGFRVFVGSKNYDNTLSAGASVPRTYEVDLPQVLRTDGTMTAFVELIQQQGAGELIADQGNNTATSANSIQVEKRLFLSETRILLEEGASRRITLTRSGDWSMEEAFTLTETNEAGNDKLLTLPATVVIPAKQSAVQFTVQSVDNTDVNAQFRTGISAVGSEYPAASMIVDVQDNDKWPLTLTTDKDSYTEGDAVTLTLTIAQALDDDLKVDITNTATARFYPFVRSITIPAGQLSAQATTQVVDDHYPMADTQPTFTATATGYETAQKTISLTDNDWPELSMTLTPATISEGGGYGAAMATISRSGDTQENVTVFVTSTSNELYFDSNKNIIPAGQSSITIPVSVMDNALIDGQRTATITAAVCDAQTGQAAGQGSPSYCSADVTISDDDSGLTLKMQSSTATLPEGGGSATVTVTRNTTESDCILTLSSDDHQLEFPATLTIAAGQQSATFTVKANRNTTEGDDHYSSVTASAADYQSASFTFLVSDQTLPQSACDAPVLNVATAYGGQTVSTTLTVSNEGTAPLPAGMNVKFYVSTDRTVRYDFYHKSPMQEVATFATTKAVAAGSSETMEFSIALPDNLKEQQYYLFAWLNQDQATEEINRVHMPSATVPLFVKAPFDVVTLTTDAENYSRGDVMHISGQMNNTASGVSMDGREVDIYFIDTENNREVHTTAMDADGRFSLDYTVGNLAGRYGVGACSNNAGSTAVQAHVNVSALKLNPNYLKLALTEGQTTEGTVSLTNLSATFMTDLRFAIEGLPEGWTATLTDDVATLAAGATTSIGYSIVPSTASADQRYAEAALTVTATDNGQTVQTRIPLYYYSYAAQCQLVTDADAGIKTTVAKDTERTWTLVIQNTGLTATGQVSVECPASQPWLRTTMAQLPSIEKDGRTELQLTFGTTAEMLVDGTYESYVRLTPENGRSIVVPVKVTVVSTDLTTLTVDVVDAYTLGADDGNGPHVSGATVRLTNALTGEVVMTGTTGDDGLYSTNILKEGTYYVYVTAPNHYYTEKTITVSPEEENTMQVFLNYQAVKMDYTVERTTVEDEYVVVLSMDIVPDIPQAIVVPTLPGNWGCGLNTYSIRLTNKGRLTATNPYLEFPVIEGYSFAVKSAYPDVIYPGESYDVTVEYQGPEDQLESCIGGIRMHYSYQLQGNTYQTSETYAVKVGCDDGIPTVLGGGGLDGDVNNVNLGGNDVDLNVDLNAAEDQDEKGNTGMPNIQVRDYTQTNHNAITMQFEQRFILTREAFRGNLTIQNQQMEAIEDIQFVPTVETTDGQNATDLFAVSTKVNGQQDDEAGWNIAATATGTATALYVPSKEAAPTEAVEYLFGGTVTYRDVQTGQLITQELMKTRLAVNPSPDLHLTYFVQRDFLVGEPAQFALLVQNKGAGAAIDLKIETSEPTVVSNENNLPVEFTTLYTTLDGVAGNFKFTSLDLGRIAPGKNLLARWWFASNVNAHVANYEVRMTKASNYGEEFNLITLDGVRELTHSVTGTIRPSSANSAKRRIVSGNGIQKDTNIFLLNQIEDEENQPDYVIDENGEGTDDLEIVSGKTMLTATDNEGEYTLTMTASREGWVYGVLHDPTNCSMLLTKVVRQSDGADMTANFWQTDRTVQADFSVMVDNRLHWADNTATAETYTLYYEPLPTDGPKVGVLELLTDDDISESHATQARLVFDAPIDAASFTADDVVLMAGGRSLTTVVEKVSDTEYIIDWSNNQTEGGHYELTVFTSGIKNAAGTAGTTSETISWTGIAQMRGDANDDGQVTIADVTATVNFILGSQGGRFVYNKADINHDQKVTTDDVKAIVNMILGK